MGIAGFLHPSSQWSGRSEIRRQIQLAFEQAEKEVADLHQRTREGIQTARFHGKQIGQLPGKNLVTKKSVKSKQLIQKYSRDFDGALGDVECIKLIGIARGTYYKHKRELKNMYMIADSEMAQIFRVERTKNFTVMSNHH